MGEPFGKKQVGSSAMPFKRNPINAEKIDSLARMLAQYPRLAWDNAAHTLLERTLDDSANRRTSLPEAFLILDELLLTSTRIIKDLRVDGAAMKRNFAIYGPFAASERVLMALGKAGADRQVMHEQIRELTLRSWDALRAGEPNPLIDMIAAEPAFLQYLSSDDLLALMDATDYIGDAPERAKLLAKQISESLKAQSNLPDKQT
jgi:adenylosuccinate lyase